MTTNYVRRHSLPAVSADGSEGEGARRGWRRVLLRLAVIGLVVGAVVAAAGSYALNVWLPDYRPRLGPGEVYGIDVSHHQRGGIDWERVAGDDITFAYIKATEGGDHVDREFLRNWIAADQAGLRRGAYHFFTLCTPGTVQAENFLATVPDDARAMAPAVDLEVAGNCSRRPTREWVHRELRTFLHAVESETGHRAVLYFGSPWDGFELRYRVQARFDRPLWQRSIAFRPGGDWHVWQLSGVSNVDGVRGPVDLNVGRNLR
jgi:lysozyme